MDRFLKKIFNFCASLQLAVINLSGFGLLLAIATFYESKHGIEAAQQQIYKTAWFDTLIFLIGVNVTCAALSRYPWKKKHTGFVITHIGIIIILVGSLITRKFGVEGQIALLEGNRTDHLVIQDDIILSVAVPGLGVNQEFDPWFIDKSIPEGKEISYPVGDTGIVCYVDRYIFDPRVEEEITNDGIQPNPAVEISVFAPNAPQPFSDWLFSDIPGRNLIDLSIAKVQFHGRTSVEEFERLATPQNAADLPENGEIVLTHQASGDETRISVDELQTNPVRFEHQGIPYTVKLLDILERAVVKDIEGIKRLVNDDQGALNPAVKFELTGPNGKEEHLIFALFPDLGSLHGGQEENSGYKVTYSYPLAQTNSGENKVDLFVLPDGAVHYVAKNMVNQTSSGPVEVGKPFDTTWNGVMMQVNHYYPTAKMNQIITDAGRIGGKPHNLPITHVRLEHNGQAVEDYVGFNKPKVLAIGGQQCIVEFGQRRVDLGIQIQLVDFRAPRYPGTNQPERFESDVIVYDPISNDERKHKIHMNHPLYQTTPGFNFLGIDIDREYAIYQASYEEGVNGAPDTSIFSVAYAPGTSIIYIGSIVMVVGMIIFFKSRRLYFPKSKDDVEF